MSDTPETDNAEWDADMHNMAVDSDFARKLERQRNELLEDRERLLDALVHIQNWDCLNPPRPDLLGDLPWLKTVVDDAINAVKSKAIAAVEGKP